MQIYFIVARNPGHGVDFVKIGVSTCVQTRMENMQVGCPLDIKLKASVEMRSDYLARLVESSIHRKFKDFHVRGEWFKLSAKIENFIYNKLIYLGDVNEMV